MNLITNSVYVAHIVKRREKSDFKNVSMVSLAFVSFIQFCNTKPTNILVFVSIIRLQDSEQKEQTLLGLLATAIKKIK